MVDDLHPMSRRSEDMRRRRPLLVRVFDDERRPDEAAGRRPAPFRSYFWWAQRVPQSDPLPGPLSLVLLMQDMELIDPLDLRSAGGGVDLEGH
jgi:hypothetical protein